MSVFNLINHCYKSLHVQVKNETYFLSSPQWWLSRGSVLVCMKFIVL